MTMVDLILILYICLFYTLAWGISFWREKIKNDVGLYFILLYDYISIIMSSSTAILLNIHSHDTIIYNNSA